MKHLLILTLALLLAACGPDKAQLQSELQSIDAEMLDLRLAAEQHRARRDEAEYSVLVGSFAAGYGATSGDYELAGEGVDAAVHSSRQHDTSSRSLDQLTQRHEQLAKRRAEIVAQLD